MTAEHHIQPYRDDSHRSGLIQLWHEAFHQPTGHNDPQRSLDKKLALADGLLFVVTVGDQVVGSVMAGYDGHRGWLYSVAVLAAQRRRGIGAALVKHAEQALIQRGCVKVNLQVVAGNEEVVGFYEALGFAQEPRISMGKLHVPLSDVDAAA
jgi:ribosomal protein S18 acetylase RimI-like enzyme